MGERYVTYGYTLYILNITRWIISSSCPTTGLKLKYFVFLNINF